MLRHYLNRGGKWSRGLTGSYRLVESPLWAPEPKSFGDEIDRMTRMHRLAAGQRFWVVHRGPDPAFDREISRRFPSAYSYPTWTFGELSILEVSL